MHKDLAGDDFRISVITRTTIHRAFVQVSLYGLLLSQAAAGVGDSPFGARRFALFLWRIPQLLPTDPASRASFYFAHQLGTCLLAVLVAGHAAASLFHHFIHRDDVCRVLRP
jgi:cytochrome b561